MNYILIDILIFHIFSCRGHSTLCCRKGGALVYSLESRKPWRFSYSAFSFLRMKNSRTWRSLFKRRSSLVNHTLLHLYSIKVDRYKIIQKYIRIQKSQIQRKKVFLHSLIITRLPSSSFFSHPSFCSCSIGSASLLTLDYLLVDFPNFSTIYTPPLRSEPRYTSIRPSIVKSSCAIRLEFSSMQYENYPPVGKEIQNGLHITNKFMRLTFFMLLVFSLLWKENIIKSILKCFNIRWGR